MVNKKTTFTIIILSLLIIIVSVYFGLNSYKNYKKSQIGEQAAQLEYEYGYYSKSNIELRPFLKHLPLKDDKYSIDFDSSNNEIKIYMIDNGQDFSTTKSQIEDSVIIQLQKIGVDTNTQKIIWLIQKK